MKQCVELNVKGVVQGVGFRPFVFKTAKQLGIKGFVLNNSAGVLITAEGEKDNLHGFINTLNNEAPSASKISAITCKNIKPLGFDSFEIKESTLLSQKSTEISSDIATCPKCQEEISNPLDRRHNYPFTNCTDCGPRFSIIKDIPYDRANTTMEPFKMCDDCLVEYQDPSNRRFHAEPNACPVCGPQLTLLDNKKKEITCEDLIEKTAELLKQGKIVAIKGIGGFHLTCDAENEKAVRNLRNRKYREDKPFALMAHLDKIKEYCCLSAKEEALLKSPERPIVLLKAKKQPAKSVAPKQKRLGFMTPYSPLHFLLMEMFHDLLIMTSANVSDEPICFTNEEALEKLNNIADYFLLNDREIETRCDDSVVRVYREEPLSIRRSRGYAPRSFDLPKPLKKQTIALGAHLKNTFCLAKDNKVFLSHHIGDLENAQTLEALKKGIAQYKKLFDVTPVQVACDLHPEYLSTKFANETGLPIKQIQHHHAHLSSCLFDNRAKSPVIGVIFDGLGLGDDGKLWGGEFLIGGYKSYKRAATLKEMPMPGGEAAIKEPWRMALSYLKMAGIESRESGVSPSQKLWRASGSREKNNLINEMIHKKLNCPLTTSMGRLFDAVSSILGICQRANYEGQPAIELQMAADPTITDTYPYEISNRKGILEINPLPMIDELIREKDKVKASSKFHNSIVSIILDTVIQLSQISNLKDVALSGGVFQNELLLDKTVNHLEKKGFKVYYHREIPTNDGGISIGQIATLLGEP